MISGTESYNKMLEYINSSIDFIFLDNIPGSSGDFNTQENEIMNIILSNKENDNFLEFNTYTFNLIQSEIVENILSLSWTKASGAKNNIVSDDTLGLSYVETVNSIKLLLIIKDIFHTLPIASLPVFNEYKYKSHKFFETVKETIDFAIDTVSEKAPSVSPIFFSLAAKSILPYTKMVEEVSSISRILSIFFHLSRIMALYPNSSIKEKYVVDSLKGSILNLKNNSTFFGLDYNILKDIYERAMIGDIIWKI